MACFFIIDVYIDKNKGRGSYDDYIEKVKPIVEKYGGEYIARTENVTSLSPLRKPDRVIIIRFPFNAQEIKYDKDMKNTYTFRNKNN